MKRSASLDFLRGAAAFAVAIPHYLTANAPFQPFTESFAIAGVEVFFVLSGFVLAPQIVDWVVDKPWRNLGVFLVRRWMRTIPPYVVALVVIAVLTGNLMTTDFVRYLFYVENLFSSANHVDFYPVAWSLAVEEWFYLLFAPAMFIVARLLGKRDRRFEAIFAVLVILVFAALRLVCAPHDWDLNVRRVTLFRIDSIVWGFLLYLALEGRLPIELKRALGRWRLAVLLAMLAVAIPAELAVSILAVEGGAAAQIAFPYVSAAFGMIAVGVLWQAEGLFRNRIVRGASFYLGRVSYSVYLFHLIIIMALKPLMASTPLALQLAVYVLAILALSTVFFAGFERPILAARPYYGGARRADAVSRRDRPAWRTARLTLLAFHYCARCRHACRGRARPQRLHGGQALCVLSALGRDGGARACARGAGATLLDRRARNCRARFPLVCAHAPVRGRSLPRLDRSAAGRDSRSAHLFLSRRACEPDRLRNLVVLLSQRMDPRGRDKIGDRCAGPAKEAALRTGSGQLGAHVRHHDPHQQSRLSRTRLAARQGRRVPHCRAWRVADLRTHSARWREALARTAAGPVRPACVVRPQNRGRQRRNRGLYAR